MMLILKEKASVFETEDVATYVNDTIDRYWLVRKSETNCSG